MNPTPTSPATSAMWAWGAVETNSCGRFVAEIFLNLMNAFVFPGQGAQFPGMGKDLFDQSDLAKRRFAEANDVLGFDIASTMFEGTPKPSNKPTSPNRRSSSTRSSWPNAWGTDSNPTWWPDTALANSVRCRSGVVEFWRGWRSSAPVPTPCRSLRTATVHHGRVLGLDNEVVETICNDTQGVVVAELQLPWTIGHFGEVPAVEAACAALSEAGARRALMLPVGGAFHSPLMEPAREKLAQAIESAAIEAPAVRFTRTSAPNPPPTRGDPHPIGRPTHRPVRWTQTMQAMIADGGKRHRSGARQGAQGLFKKVDRAFPTSSATWHWKKPEASCCAQKSHPNSGGFFVHSERRDQEDQPSALSAWAA